MAEGVRFALEIANDEYDAPIKKGFEYSINRELETFLVDLKRLEAIRRELLKSEKVRDPSPPHRGWGNHRVSHDGPENRAWPKLTVDDDGLQVLNDEGRQIMSKLDRFLSRFVTFPRLYCYRLTSIRTLRSWPRTEERILGHGVEQILEALHNRYLDRIRVCGESDCKRWFFAITKHQEYCGTACRIRDVARSPAFKEKRARYMRERYRPQVRQMEERARQLASKK
jgi:hypothetical protein